MESFHRPGQVRRYALSVFCESWRSSAAAVTRSKSESSPMALPFFFLLALNSALAVRPPSGQDAEAPAKDLRLRDSP